MPTFGEPVERYEIEPTGRVVREARTPVLDDAGKIVGWLPPHRRPIEPDQDVSLEAPDIKRIVNAARTPERLARWEAAKEQEQT